MRITAVRTEHLALPLDPPFNAAWDPVGRARFDVTLARVETDEGLVGVGSGDGAASFGPYAGLLVGEDPLRLARHARTLRTVAFHAGRPWAVEAALWDLAGQILGVPCATLLGGAVDRLPAYASLGELRAPGERADDALALRAKGFRAVKVRIPREHIDEGVAVVAAMRSAVGGDLDIMVDLNQWWRMPGDTAAGLPPARARYAVERLRELGVLWVEEPLAGGDLAGMRALREQTGVAIAGGEMAHSFAELVAALEQDALDVFQPDVVLSLGISGARTLAELVLARNRWFTPHTWTNGIGLLANLHLVCGVGGGPFVEYPYDPPGWTPQRRDFMLADPVGINADGCLRIAADRPGMGIVLDEERIAHHRVEVAA